jgi:hypothetical protein
MPDPTRSERNANHKRQEILLCISFRWIRKAEMKESNVQLEALGNGCLSIPVGVWIERGLDRT